MKDLFYLKFIITIQYTIYHSNNPSSDLSTSEVFYFYETPHHKPWLLWSPHSTSLHAQNLEQLRSKRIFILFPHSKSIKCHVKFGILSFGIVMTIHWGTSKYISYSSFKGFSDRVTLKSYSSINMLHVGTKMQIQIIWIPKFVLNYPNNAP